ncbi:MAG: sulfurtransferase complex subunit TusC [Halioglobus sp.]
MSAKQKRKILLVLRFLPYGSSIAKAAIDVALASAVFDQEVDLLFIGDGVLQLLPDQDGREVGSKSLGRLLSSLPLYDIDHVYADAEAISRFNLDPTNMLLEVRMLSELQIHNLMLQYDHLLGL